MKFLNLIQALTAHHLVVSGSFTKTTSATQEFNPKTFSARQQQILNGLVEGKTNYQLASELGYSVSTIRHETMRIFRILGVDNRKSAAEIAVKYGLVR
jgi:DNA-binding NarL/FixJ family response regulator